MGSRRRRSRSPAVRLRLTGAGWMFLVVTAVVAVATVKSQSATLFVIVGAMIGAVVASALMARGMLRGVELEREVPVQAWQSQTVHLGYYLRDTRRRPHLALAMEELSVSGVERTNGFCAHLPPEGTFRSGARFMARRRGRLSLVGVELFSRFPFGLVAGRCVIPCKASVVVWPARGRLKQRHASSRRGGGLLGPAHPGYRRAGRVLRPARLPQ